MVNRYSVKGLGQGRGSTQLVAVGAGLTAALLTLAAERNASAAAAAVGYLSPLPLMIATLGFGHLAGLGSAFIGALVIMVYTLAQQPHELTGATFFAVGEAGLLFLCAKGLPAWWLARLAGLSRGADAPHWSGAEAPQLGSVPYPLGRILVQACVIVAAWSAFDVIEPTLRYGSYDAALTHAADQAAPLVRSLLGEDREPLSGLDVPTLARLVVRFVPLTSAGMLLLILLVNLWLAARVAQTSNLLRRPWPDIAQDLRAPRSLVLVFAATVAACFLGDLAGALAAIAAATLAVAFALQGLAVVHVLTRGVGFRIALLLGIYVALPLLMPWPFAGLTLLGLAEAGFGLRDRKRAHQTQKT
jgi:hypothetical protein